MANANETAPAKAPGHTPGPWWDTQSYCKEIYGLESHEAVQADGRLVADICPCGDDEVAKANARLIAAAPELLEHLEWLVEAAHSVHTNWESGDLAYAVNALRVAAIASEIVIAKARGQAA